MHTFDHRRIVLWMAFVLSAMASAFVLAHWKERELIAGHAGPPVLIYVRGWRTQSVEAWNWRTNESRTIVRGFVANRVTRAGSNGVAWLSGDSLTIADIEPPHSLRRYKVPGSKYRDPVDLIGITADDRHAIIRTMPPEAQSFKMSRIEAFDLSTQTWTDSIDLTYLAHPTGIENVFNTEGTTKYRATLSPDGLFSRMVIGNVPFTRQQSLDIAEVPVTVIQTSDSCEAYVGVPNGCNGCFVGNIDGFHRFSIPISEHVQVTLPSPAVFSPDGSLVALRDLDNDLHVIDVASGKVIARDTFGTRQIVWARCVFAFALALAVAWMWVLSTDARFPMAVFDVSAILLLLTLATMAWPILFRLAPYTRWTWILDQFLMSPRGTLPYLGPISFIAACGVAVGWYWTFGEGKLHQRWILGALWLVVMATPAVVSIRLIDWPYRIPFPENWIPFAALGIVVATGVSLILLGFHAIGWTVARRTDTADRWAGQFTLGTMMLRIAGFGIALAAVNIVTSWWDRLFFGDERGLLPGVLAPLLLGLLLPAIWLRETRTRYRVALVALAVTIAVVQAMFWFLFIRPMPVGVYQVEYTMIAATTLVSLLFASAARRAGWRWTKRTARLAQVSTVSAA